MTSRLPVEREQGFTYGDYRQWDDQHRWELIDGMTYNMTPAPSRKHQKISMELSRQLSNFLKDKSCEVYAAPFDVRLPEQDEPEDQIKTVVQPDISIICDKNKLDNRGCLGAPDLIIEIVSPFTAAKDMKHKLFLYERHGIKEYWLVHPEEKILMQYTCETEKRYGRAIILPEEDTIRTNLLKGLEIGLDSIFQ